MTKGWILFSAVLLLEVLGGCAAKHPLHEAEAVHQWGYTASYGPQQWGDLEKDFFMCKEGKNQSPVDIADARAVDKKRIAFHYFSAGEHVVIKEHAVQVNYRPGSSVTIDGHMYGLRQFHFRTPGETTIAGKRYPMEAQFLHQDKHGNIAILSVMFEEGAENPEITKIVEVLSKEANVAKKLLHTANALALLPKDVDYYRYNGSLTTPPCSEGVVWVVFKKPVTASRAQIRRLYDEIGHPNDRPVQPINARVILR